MEGQLALAALVMNASGVDGEHIRRATTLQMSVVVSRKCRPLLLKSLRWHIQAIFSPLQSTFWATVLRALELPLLETQRSVLTH